ncbi:MAG: hypothetical protein AABZ08_04940 [Planctomycetota bacterium]
MFAAHKSRKLLRMTIWATGVAILFGITDFFYQRFLVSPMGSSEFVFISAFLFLPGCIGFVLVPFLGIACLSKKYSGKAFPLFVASLVLVGGTFWAGRIGSAVRRDAFAALAIRSKPLVAAIRAYERDHGSPPEILNNLVPDYLASIPSTGMGAYPTYRYGTDHVAKQWKNPWVLYVFTPSGGINFDEFAYLPNQNYPSEDSSGYWERIEDWAYLHE